MRTGSWGVRAGAVPVRSQHEGKSLHHPGCSACEYVSESVKNGRTLKYIEEREKKT